MESNTGVLTVAVPSGNRQLPVAVGEHAGSLVRHAEA